MRIITKEYEVYEFDELSEKGKDNALRILWDINVDYRWWDFILVDAQNIGLKIEEFDLDRGSFVKGQFTIDSVQVAKEIIKSHGKGTESYKDAKWYLRTYGRGLRLWIKDTKELQGCQSMEEWSQSYTYSDYVNEDLEADFLYRLCEDYRITLQMEHDYLTSEETIIESIKANEYEFFENGELVPMDVLYSE